MRMALELAKQGEGWVSPNPMVGCVVVKNGKVIARGYHEKYGGFHAERNALLHCEEETEGAELYVTLEPCCHQGKTPPCTDIIIEKKIGKVFVGSLDINPKVAGKGVNILREHGIQVEVGILEEECRKLNEAFFYYMEQKLPFVAMKYAMTLDGKIACETGDSKWVTGEEARNYVQRLRNRYRGIMAGIGTVLADDPLLNCRMEGGRNPVRILCDARLRIPLDSRIVQTAGEYETILVWNPQAAEAYYESETCSEEILRRRSGSKEMPGNLHEKAEFLAAQGIALLEIPVKKTGAMPELDLGVLMEELGARGIDSILLEGGGMLNASALQERVAQRIYAFVAPKLVAGAGAKSPVEGVGIARMEDAVKLQETEIISYGEDICITGRIKYPKG